MKKIFLLPILSIFILSNPLDASATKTRNASLSIAPTTLMQNLSQSGHIFLVDVRNQSDFNKFKIPGSINIPLSFIKTKAFLKSHPVVLIHEGHTYTEIEKEADALNQGGFDIKILEGGLWAWKHKGGDIVGDPFSQRDLNKMSARDFFQEKEYGNLIVIDASSTPSEKVERSLPKAIRLSDSEDRPDVNELVTSIFIDRKKLKKYQKGLKIPEGVDLVKAAKTDPLLSVVIITETGTDYAAIEDEIDEACRDRVFFLEGGLEGYEKFLKFKLLANRPRNDRIKTTEGCEECEKETLESKLN